MCNPYALTSSGIVEMLQILQLKSAHSTLETWKVACIYQVHFFPSGLVFEGPNFFFVRHVYVEK